MLHFMFDEPERVPDGALAEACSLMERFAAYMDGRIQEAGDSAGRLLKLRIWTLGLCSSLRELEQSHYAAGKFRSRIQSDSVEDMDREEKLDYDRYVYFDKNAFIRVFSLLDKLGTLLNELLQLQTEKVKPHFSYFTVLRHMRERQSHPDLTWRLNAVKEHYADPMRRLRKRRNTEIHYMNSEMHDDLIQSQRLYGEEIRLENVAQQADDLTACLHMTVESLRLSFQYACQMMRSLKA
jgi:hypothetical protein